VKKLLLCAAAILFCAGMVRAQESDQDQPVNPEMQRQELINLELENARAIKLHNTTFFKAAYSEDFHGVTRYGEMVSKQGIIHEVETMTPEFDSVVSSDTQVRTFRDAAYVLSLRSEVGRADGKKFYNQFRILRVYVNTPRGWRIVSQLETKLATDANR
jgi:ketosteroid isomerase-like protein